MTVSPCISICKMDPRSGYCTGCARTSEEKIKWKDKKTTDKWKLENIQNIKKRKTNICKTYHYFLNKKQVK